MTLPGPPGQRLLVYGIGNVGRQDDGLGVRLVERLAEAGLPGNVTLEANYQLNPEDALALSRHEAVIFVDATAAPAAEAPYSLEPVVPASEISFSSHALSIGSLLALCARLYGTAPTAYALALPGYSFEVNEELSPRAHEHLEQAIAALLPLLQASA